MKKILSFVTVFLLIVVLSVPALAASSTDPIGAWTFKTSLRAGDGYQWNVNFTCNDVEYVKMFHSKDLAGTAMLYFYTASGSSVTVYSGGWQNAIYRDIIVTGGPDVNNDTFMSFLNGNATPARVCDGSTCSATDLNADGICDDCGAPLSLRLTGYPVLPAVNGNNLESVVLQRDDGYFYMALTSDTPYSVSGSVGDNYLITVADETDVSYVTYKCTDGQNWVHNSSGSAYSLSVGSPSATLLASTFDWYKDGSLFFQVPLWTEMGLVTQGEMQGLTMETFGTMNILLLCGVGLMASLMLLALFGKRSLLYRK